MKRISDKINNTTVGIKFPLVREILRDFGSNDPRIVVHVQIKSKYVYIYVCVCICSMYAYVICVRIDAFVYVSTTRFGRIQKRFGIGKTYVYSVCAFRIIARVLPRVPKNLVEFEVGDSFETLLPRFHRGGPCHLTRFPCAFA